MGTGPERGDGLEHRSGDDAADGGLVREQVGELATEQAQDFDLYDLAPVGCCTVSEAGEIMLMQALRERGVPTVREQVAATLSWLNIRGLVKAELPGGVYVAKLTAQGRSVARDEFRYDGVAPPELG